MNPIKIHVYEASDGYRWRARARNGKIVAESGEAYGRLAAARKAAQKMVDTPLVLVEPAGDSDR